MNEIIRRFIDDEQGAEMLEWAVVTVILLIATVGILVALRDTIIDVIKSILGQVQEDPTDAWQPTPGAAPGGTPGPVPTNTP